jgi:hypothetical protein
MMDTIMSEQLRLRITRPGLLETGRIGDGFWDSENGWWYVTFGGNEPPYRGFYEPGEVEIVVDARQCETR